MIEAGLLTAFVVLLSGLAWWMWEQRQQARQRAETNEQLAALGRDVKAIAHDTRQLLSAILPNVEAARDASPEELPELLRSIERAAEVATAMLRALHGGDAATAGRRSAEGVVRLAIALARGSRVGIHLQVTGKLHYDGADLDALRVVQNLLGNAVREAASAAGDVQVELTDGALRVANPLRPGNPPSERIWDEGVSGHGSTGLGLAIARDVAGRIGWRLQHEVDRGEVRFVVTPEATPRRGAPS